MPVSMCRVHHKMIDDLVDDYTADKLRRIKEEHELWVSDRLNDEIPNVDPIRIRRIKENIPHILLGLTTGNELTGILDGAMSFSFDHDEPRDEDEMKLISEFAQAIQDCGDLWSDLEVGEKVKMAYLMTGFLERLEKNEYYVFGARENQVIEGGYERPKDWPVAIVHVRHKGNPEIQRFDIS